MAKELGNGRSMLAPPLTLFQNPGVLRSNSGIMGPEAGELFDGSSPRVHAWATAWQSGLSAKMATAVLQRGWSRHAGVCKRPR